MGYRGRFRWTEDCWRGALPMERHGNLWKVLEGSELVLSWFVPGYWWMTELLYASCLLSHLIVVSLPFLDMWTLLILTHCCLPLLTDCLLSMTNCAYCTPVEVLISHSIVASSSPAWLLVFYRRSTRAYKQSPLSLSTSVASPLPSLTWTLFYITCATIQLVVCIIIHIIDLCNWADWRSGLSQGRR